jgi:hypothetical protein
VSVERSFAFFVHPTADSYTEQEGKEAQFVLAAVNPVQQQYKQLAAFSIHP